MRILLLLVLLLFSRNAFFHLSFCPGSYGDAIFNETLSTISGTGIALSGGVLNYDYVAGIPYWEMVSTSS